MSLNHILTHLSLEISLNHLTYQPMGHINAIKHLCRLQNLFPIGQLLLLQDSSFCSPKDFACYTTISTDNTFGCRVSCTGLYADVEFTEDRILADNVYNVLTDLAAKGPGDIFKIRLSKTVNNIFRRGKRSLQWGPPGTGEEETSDPARWLYRV